MAESTAPQGVAGRRLVPAAVATSVLWLSLASAPPARLTRFEADRAEVLGGADLALTLTFAGQSEARPTVSTSDPRVIPFSGPVPNGGSSSVSLAVRTRQVSRPTDVTLTAEWLGERRSVTVRVVPTGMVEHQLTGGDLQRALRLARERGFGFSSRTTDDGRCDTYPMGWAPAGTGDPTMVARPVRYAARADGPGADRQICEFDLLTGRPLAEGWRMLDVRLGPVHVHLGDASRSGARFSRTATRNSPDASFSVSVVHVANRAPGPSDGSGESHTAVTIDRIRVLGPAGADWREAFW